MPQFDILSFFNQSFYLFIFIIFSFIFLFQYLIPALLRPLYIRSKYYRYVLELNSIISAKKQSTFSFIQKKFKNYFTIC